MLDNWLIRTKMVNYMSRTNSWSKFWTVWDTENIRQELDLIRDLGVNVIRIFLTHQEFFDFTPERKAQLDFVLGECEARRIQVIPTLFVHANLNWKKPDTTFLFLEKIIGAYKDDPRIYGWDYCNELDHYYVENGIVNETQTPYGNKTIPYYEIFVRWANAVYYKIKEIDAGNHRIWAGQFGWDIRLGRKDIGFPTDVINFHLYSNPTELDWLIKKAVEMYPGLPILVSEIGFATAGVGDKGETVGNEETAYWNYVGWEQCREQNQSLAHIMLMSWNAFDIGETPVLPKGHADHFYGLYDLDYNLKRTGQVFKEQW